MDIGHKRDIISENLANKILSILNFGVFLIFFYYFAKFLSRRNKLAAEYDKFFIIQIMDYREPFWATTTNNKQHQQTEFN